MDGWLIEVLVVVPTVLVVSLGAAVVFGRRLGARSEHARRVDLGAGLGVRRHPADFDGGGEL